MPNCPSCGRDNPEGFRLCGFCGHSLTLPEAAEIRKIVTVVFSDIVGSTSLGERLDPESVRRVMSRYFEEMRRVLERHGGTVEKFVGDSVMAVFGVPALHEDDALRAARAADEMRRVLSELNDELVHDFSVRLQSRTGVNTGEVVAGDPTVGQTLVTGDAVNVAARLQQAAGADEILIGEGTFRLVRDAAVTEPVEPLSVKGKTEKVAARRLVEVVQGVPGVARRLDSPMVGRDRELELLREAFRRAEEERACRMVTIFGSPGVGKSRLAHELLSSVAGRAKVLRGRCLPYGEGITFWPVREIVQGAAGLEEGAGPDEVKAAIERLLPPGEDVVLVRERLAAALGFGEPLSGVQEVFWAFRRMLEAVAARRPLVVVFDDVHWAEPTLLDLVEYVAGFSREASLLLLCTARPELQEVRPGWAATRPNAESLLLEPLSEDEGRRLVEKLLGTADLPEQLERRVVQAAEGNPLFVEELLQMLIDDGLLRRDDGRWIPVGDLSSISTPPTIQALLAARLDRLHDEERSTLQRASVVGKVFWWGAVAAMGPEETRSRVALDLQALVRRGLIQPDSSSFPGEDAFRFSHILVRDAAYGSTPKLTRAELHERFADWLEGRAGGEGEYAAILGHHLEQAHRYRTELGPADDSARALARRAASHLRAAGRSALGRRDTRAAVNLLERATELLPDGEEDRRGLLVDMASALSKAGKLDRSNELLEEATRLAREAHDAHVEWLARIGRCSIILMREPEGAVDEAAREAEAAIRAREEEEDHLVLARAWRLFGDTNWMRGQADATDRAWGRALEHARLAGDAAEQVEILTTSGGLMVFGPLPVEEGLGRVQDVVDRMGDVPAVREFALHVKGHLLARLGEFGEARSAVSRWRQMLLERGSELPYAITSGCAWDVVSLEGDWVEGERILREGHEILDRMKEKSYLSTIASNLAEAIYQQGRYEEAERFSRISEESGASDDYTTQVGWRTVRAKVCASRGSLADAERLAREAIDIAARTGFLEMHADALLALADILRSVNRPKEARASVEEAIALYARKGNLVAAERARELL